MRAVSRHGPQWDDFRKKPVKRSLAGVKERKAWEYPQIDCPKADAVDSRRLGAEETS